MRPRPRQTTLSLLAGGQVDLNVSHHRQRSHQGPIAKILVGFFPSLSWLVVNIRPFALGKKNGRQQKHKPKQNPKKRTFLSFSFFSPFVPHEDASCFYSRKERGSTSRIALLFLPSLDLVVCQSRSVWYKVGSTFGRRPVVSRFQYLYEFSHRTTTCKTRHT